MNVGNINIIGDTVPAESGNVEAPSPAQNEVEPTVYSPEQGALNSFVADMRKAREGDETAGRTVVGQYEKRGARVVEIKSESADMLAELDQAYAEDIQQFENRQIELTAYYERISSSDNPDLKRGAIETKAAIDSLATFRDEIEQKYQDIRQSLVSPLEVVSSSDRSDEREDGAQEAKFQKDRDRFEAKRQKDEQERREQNTSKVNHADEELLDEAA